MESICKARNEQDVEGLVEELRSRDAMTRVRARERLAAIGLLATPRLTELLKDSQQHLRWESAKTLVEIADPKAAPALIEAMEDEDEDVRWVAADAVIALSEAAIRPLLSALIERSSSIRFCQSTHHVLSAWVDVDRFPELLRVRAALKRVRAALKDVEPGVIVPVAAEAVLRQLTCPG